MREALVEVFNDHPRVVQHQIPVNEGGHTVIRIQVEQVLGKTSGLALPISMLMPFSASTIRGHGLTGHRARENRGS